MRIKGYGIILIFFALYTGVTASGGENGYNRHFNDQAFGLMDGDPLVVAFVPVGEKTIVEEEPEPVAGKIRGRVLDDANRPVRGIEVSCYDENGKKVATTVTDENGYYTFENLDFGNYTIQAGYSGFSGPLEIKFEESRKRPPIPTGLRVEEIAKDLPEGTFLRAWWDSMPNVDSYRSSRKEAH